jgi:hypothetical protein
MMERLSRLVALAALGLLLFCGCSEASANVREVARWSSSFNASRFNATVPDDLPVDTAKVALYVDEWPLELPPVVMVLF